MKIRGYFLPPQVKVKEYTTLAFDRVKIEVPVLTPNLIFNITDHLLDFHDRVLAKRPVHSILKSVDSAIRLWQKSYDRRRLAIDALPSITGFSPEMVARIFERPWTEYRHDKVKTILEKN